MVCRQTCLAAGCAALLIVIVLTSISSSFGQEKSPVPSETAQRKALDLIREVYGEEQEHAKTTSQRRILAKKLADKAKTSMDAANRYVLLKVAQDLAAQAGDAELAFEAIDTMARRYDVDTYKLKGVALSRAAETAESQEHFKAIAQLALSLTGQAVEQDDFEAAKSVGKLAVDAARKARDTAFLKKIVARNKEVREIAEACAAVRDARAVLKDHPVDPEANLAVGKYYCLMKGDWKDGILMLVLGSDEDLKKLALKELKGGPGAAAQAEIGDGWWDMAENADGVAKEQLLARAVYWYRRAAPDLKGLPKDKVDKRLKEVAQQSKTGSSPPVVRRFKSNVIVDDWIWHDGTRLTVSPDGTFKHYKWNLGGRWQTTNETPLEYEFRWSNGPVRVFALSEDGNGMTSKGDRRSVRRKVPLKVDASRTAAAAQAAKDAERKQRTPKKPTAIVEGVGFGAFRVGATKADLIKAFGNPDAGSTDRWLQWKQRLHIHCLMDPARGAVELRFDPGFPLPVASGIAIGSPEQALLTAYGTPDHLTDKGAAKKYEYSKRGVLFWTNHGRVSQMVVFRPSR